MGNKEVGFDFVEYQVVAFPSQLPPSSLGRKECGEKDTCLLRTISFIHYSLYIFWNFQGKILAQSYSTLVQWGRQAWEVAIWPRPKPISEAEQHQFGQFTSQFTSFLKTVHRRLAGPIRTMIRLLIGPLRSVYSTAS